MCPHRPVRFPEIDKKKKLGEREYIKFPKKMHDLKAGIYKAV